MLYFPRNDTTHPSPAGATLCLYLTAKTRIQAVFYSYLGPDGRTDIGHTRHSACPVLEGTKWVASMWMRLGVTAERNWQHYDPSGREAIREYIRGAFGAY